MMVKNPIATLLGAIAFAASPVRPAAADPAPSAYPNMAPLAQ